MADIINAASGYQTGSIDTATTLVNNVSPTDAKHINYPAGAIIQIETILGSGTTLKGSAADTATRLGIALEANGKLKDFSSTTKTTFPTTVAEAGTGAVSFTDGAVLLGNGTGALQALALPSSLKVLSHSGSAGTDPSWISGLLYQGPSSVGSGSTNTHNGAYTVSSNGDYSGIIYCTDFTLNVSTTMTVPSGKRRVIIIASNSITINGTITAASAGASGGAGGQDTIDVNGYQGSPGTDQVGGNGGQGNPETGGWGGNVELHGQLFFLGAAPGGVNSTGTAGTQLTGSAVAITGLTAMGGAGGGGGVGFSTPGAVGGVGGGSIVLIAPTVTLASTATLNTSGGAGSAGGANSTGAGGGGAGNVTILCRSYTDNGCIFTLTGGAGGTSSSQAGGAGATGIKQINIYA